jgi:hypothetical protein
MVRLYKTFRRPWLDSEQNFSRLIKLTYGLYNLMAVNENVFFDHKFNKVGKIEKVPFQSR